MQNLILFVISLAWIGIGSWACLYANDSKVTRLLGMITLVLGIEVLSYSL
jgi:hypothetical protein